MKPVRAAFTTAVLVFGLAIGTAAAEPAGTGFTYQGQLKEAGVPVSGTCDFEFTLWDAWSGGAQVGPTLLFDGYGGNPPPVEVVNGL